MSTIKQGIWGTRRFSSRAGKVLAALALVAAGAACSGGGSTDSGASSPSISYTGPSTWTITGPQGGPFQNRSMDILLQNNGSAPIDWSASSIPSFVVLDPNSGTIQGNSQTTVHAALDPVLAGSLPIGNSGGLLAFHNETSQQDDIGIDVTLSISAPGVSIVLLPATDFSTSGPAGGPFAPPSTTYSLTNTGSATLTWQANTGAAWVTASPSSGQLAPNASVNVDVAIVDASTGTLSTGMHWSFVDIVDSTSSATLDTRDVGLSITGGSTAGWTVFTPSSDTRMVYVSNSLGNNANDGLSEATPKRTIAAGKALLRNTYPDWLLLRCGDVWDENLGDWEGISGRSTSERMLIGSYGSGARPLLRTGTNFGARLLNHNNPANFVAFVGLHFWAHTYNGSNGSPVGFVWYEQSQGLLIEDCMIQAYSTGLVLQAGPEPMHHVNVQLRRNVVCDSYTTTSAWAAGMYVEMCQGLLLEENLFDRNGWSETIPGSTPSWFEHNVYIHNNNSGVVVRGNIVAGCDGVQVRPGGTVEDNVFLRTAIALEFGLGTYPNAGGVSGFVRNNVVLDGGDIGTTGPSQGPRGWGFQIGNITSSTIENNIICNNVNGHGPRAISAEHANGYNGNTRGVENTTFQNNIIYNWGGSLEFHTSIAQTVNFHLQNNAIQEMLGSQRLIVNFDATSIAGVQSNNNVFYSAPLTPNNWMQVGGASMSVAAWMPLVLDTTSVAQQAPFPDPNRTIATYHASLGGVASYEGFLTEARRQSKSFWRSEYTSAAVRAYIRAGFGL